MSLYSYKAVDKQGHLQRGFYEANSSGELKTALQILELSLIGYSCKPSIIFFRRKIKPLVLMNLCLQLEQFENAGIPLRESLEELYHIHTIPHLKAALKDIKKDVDGGILLSTALTKHPSIFDSVFIGLIIAGEKTGRFAFALHQLYHHFKWVDELHAQIFKALRYPFIMGSMLIGILLILMTTLVPELVKFMETFVGKGNLPFSTQLLTAFSKLLSVYFVPILGCLSFIALLSLCFYKFHPRGPFWIQSLFRYIPLIGPLRRKLAIVRFCHVFAMLFESGIDIIQALQTARQHLNYQEIDEALEKTERLIKTGHSLSSAFQQVGFFPPIVIQMVRIGERTSSLNKTLFHVKDYFDTTLKRQVDHMVGLLEPLMIIGLGGFLALVVYSVFLPLYDTLSLMDY